VDAALNQIGRTDRETVARLVKQLGDFDGSPGKFLENLVALQCLLGQTKAGAILRVESADSAAVLAAYPQPKEGAGAPDWLSKLAGFAREALDGDGAVVKPLPEPDHLYGQPASRYAVLLSFEFYGFGRLVAAFLVGSGKTSPIEARRTRLELLTNLTALYERRLTKEKGERQAEFGRLQQALETLAAVNRNRRFTAAAMAFCNEVASQWKCERVSLGFLKRNDIRLKAMSHTEDFSRKMKVVRGIERAMEECLDQDIEILYPPAKDASYICHETGELAATQGLPLILSLPLRQEGAAFAVMTLQRPEGRPFDLSVIETIRLTCDLCAPRLLELHEKERWFGDRALTAIWSLPALLEAKHTWVKATVLAVFFAVVFLLFAKGMYRPEAPFVLEAIDKQVVPAPFDGYLKEVNVEVGEMVEPGKTVLARLDTIELRLQLAAAEAERIGYVKQADAAMRDAKTAQAQIAQANADKVAAQVDLLKYRIEHASLTSPIGGAVVTGDLKRKIGAPVKTGDVLFEVARLESLRAEILVPEDQIIDVQVGQKGKLATASYPGTPIEFLVERINPAAEVVEERNVFRVRVRLQEIQPWMRPGMEGIAKIDAGERRYSWIWTRRLVNWIRMHLWL
jgi:biotin carboxyl carrier protein